MRRIFQLFPLAALIVIAACSKSSSEDPDEGPMSGKGVITGVVYSPNGKQAIAAAAVQVVVKGETFTESADIDGRFSLELPAGEYQLKISAGARLSLEKKVVVEGGKTTNLPSDLTSLTYAGKIGFVPGMFDSIQEFVKEMGIPLIELSKEDLEDYDSLEDIDVLLLNCGSSDADFEKVGANLDKFLKAGKSLYASDWAIQDLTGLYDGHSFIPESLLSWEQGGDVVTIDGNIHFEPFKQAIGKNLLSIAYSQPNYVNILDYASNDSRFTLLVSHPRQGPLALNIQWGPSKVSASGTKYGGNILYTTFHNEPIVSADVRAVLRQMILHL